MRSRKNPNTQILSHNYCAWDLIVMELELCFILLCALLTFSSLLL